MNKWLKPFAGIIAVISAIIALNRLNNILKGIKFASDTINTLNQIITDWNNFLLSIYLKIPLIQSIPNFVWDFVHLAIALLLIYFLITLIIQVDF